MEVNKRSDIRGVIVTEDIVEGRMGCITTHPDYSGDVTGRLTSFPGVKLPDDTDDAARALYPITWPVDNRSTPIVNWPTYDWSLRRSLDQDANAPITDKTIYLTYPGNQESVTIPSGTQALAYGGGVFTVPSGQFVYDATMVTPDVALRACDTETDGAAYAGMLAVLASGSTTVIARVVRYDSSAHALTFRTLSP